MNSKTTLKEKNANNYLTHTKRQRGITLVALVVTIVVLLILAGITISMMIDNNGLLGKVKEAVEVWNSAAGKEEEDLNDLLDKLDEMFPSSMITKWNIAEGDTVKIYLYSAKDGSNTLENNTNVTIDWGGGTVETINSSNLQYDSSNNGYVTHTYSVANIETKITLTGKCNTIDMNNNKKLTSIEQWGNMESIKYKFSGCSNLTTIASPEKNTFKNVTSFASTFYYCTSLASIPEDLFANCENVTSFASTFYYCPSLASIPENLFANCENVTSFTSTFAQCNSLASIPENLFANCENVTSFASTFEQCTSLTGNAIPLWERWEDSDSYYSQYGPWTSTSPNGHMCYYECNGLTNYGSIPAGWKDSDVVP